MFTKTTAMLPTKQVTSSDHGCSVKWYLFSIQSSLHPYTNDQLSNSLTLQLTVKVIEICSLKQTLKQMS